LIGCGALRWLSSSNEKTPSLSLPSSLKEKGEAGEGTAEACFFVCAPRLPALSPISLVEG